MFFELRQYRMQPGKEAAWGKFMEEEIIPFQRSKGMVIVGSFTSPEETDLFVWIRRFESEEDRERLYEAVYQTDYWQNDIGPRVAEMIFRDKIVVTRLEPTPLSIIR